MAFVCKGSPVAFPVGSLGVAYPSCRPGVVERVMCALCTLRKPDNIEWLMYCVLLILRFCVDYVSSVCLRRAVLVWFDLPLSHTYFSGCCRCGDGVSRRQAQLMVHSSPSRDLCQ